MHSSVVHDTSVHDSSIHDTSLHDNSTHETTHQDLGLDAHLELRRNAAASDARGLFALSIVTPRLGVGSSTAVSPVRQRGKQHAAQVRW